MKLTSFAVLLMTITAFAEARESQVQTNDFRVVAEYYKNKQTKADYYTGFISTLTGRQDALSEHIESLLMNDIDKDFSYGIGEESKAELIALDKLVCEQYQEGMMVYACAAEISLYNSTISIDDEVLQDLLFDSFAFNNAKSHLILTKSCDKTAAHCKLYTTMLYRKEE